MIKINEIFYSIQGESSYNGMPCVFIRLTYCNLRCSYCDTEYAFYEGKDMSIEDILKKVKSYNCQLVEVTGGEPLLQKKSIDLMEKLIEKNYTVMLETGGSLPISKVPNKVIKIIDFKCPTSKMDKKNDWSIIKDITNHDEIKFDSGAEVKAVQDNGFGLISSFQLYQYISKDNYRGSRYSQVRHQGHIFHMSSGFCQLHEVHE